MKATPMTAAALVGLALLSGCGGGGNDSAGADATATAAQGSGSVEQQVGFSQASTPAAQAAVESDIAACMKAQGFDYTPVDATAAMAALTGKSNLSDEDFTKEFGYGIATLYGEGSAQSDPNASVRRSLGAAGRRAYDRALTGGKPDQTYFRAADTGDFTQLGGCTKRAAEKLLGGIELLTTLQRKLDELDEAVLQDQRMVRAFEAWRGCMRDRTGETFEDSEAVELAIQKRLAAIVGPLPPGESAPGEFASRTPQPGYDRAALDELRRTEVKLANADVACEDEHFDPVEEVVTAEKEKQFREANAELLRKVRPPGR